MKQVEHVDKHTGFLKVPVFGSVLTPTPVREGWKPFWVSTNVNGWDNWEGAPTKIVTFKPVTS